MKILVAIDGSPCSLQALETLISHTDWFREPVEYQLIHVHPPLAYKRAVAWAGKEAVDSYYDEEAEEAIAPARPILAERGVAYTVEKRVGDPAHEIVGHAKAAGFDMIVLGTHGHTALVNLVLGSVATKVLAVSEVPVLLM